MKVSLTEFEELAYDENGHYLTNVLKDRSTCQTLSAAGSFAPIALTTRIVRIATNADIQMDITGGTTDAADELFPAGDVEFLAVKGGETFSIIVAT